jgi:hypothetical protein
MKAKAEIVNGYNLQARVLPVSVSSLPEELRWRSIVSVSTLVRFGEILALNT